MCVCVWVRARARVFEILLSPSPPSKIAAMVDALRAHRSCPPNSLRKHEILIVYAPASWLTS